MVERLDDKLRLAEKAILNKLQSRRFFDKARIFDEPYFMSSSLSLFYENMVSSLGMGLVMERFFDDLVTIGISSSTKEGHEKGKNDDGKYHSDIIVYEVSTALASGFSHLVNVNLNGQLRSFSQRNISSVVDSLIEDFSRDYDVLIKDGVIRSTDDLIKTAAVHFHAIANGKKSSLPDYSLHDSLRHANNSVGLDNLGNLEGFRISGLGSDLGKGQTENIEYIISSRAFDDVIGLDEQKEIMMLSLIEPFKHREKYDSLKKNPKKIRDHFNFLFYGPPGTGKSYFAEAVAGELQIPLFVVYGPDFVKMKLGEGKDMLNELYEKAARNAPSIVFIDEVDQVAQNRQSFESELKHDLTEALFGCMYGPRSNPYVATIMATNFEDNLDDGVWSKTPLQNHLLFPPLDDASKARILQYQLSNYNHEPLTDAEASELFNRVNAKYSRRMEQLLMFASQHALANNHSVILKDDLLKAIDVYNRRVDR